MSTFIVPQKLDLDTLAALYMLGADASSVIIVADPKNPAQLAAWLQDPEVFCIEVGGSGQTELRNFDHHAAGGPNESASMQVWKAMGGDPALEPLAKYVNIVDVEGINSLPEPKPTVVLTDVVAGLLLLAQDEKWPVPEIVKRSDLIFSIIGAGVDPFGEILLPFADYKRYLQRKVEEDIETANAALNVIILPLPNGKKIGVLISNYRGATNSAYGAGGDYALCVAPNFGKTGLRKMTVGVNTKSHPTGSVTEFLSRLNAIEPGAGGPPTGKVGGSKPGTQVPLQQLLELAMETLH